MDEQQKVSRLVKKHGGALLGSVLGLSELKTNAKYLGHITKKDLMVTVRFVNGLVVNIERISVVTESVTHLFKFSKGDAWALEREGSVSKPISRTRAGELEEALTGLAGIFEFYGVSARSVSLQFSGSDVLMVADTSQGRVQAIGR